MPTPSFYLSSKNSLSRSGRLFLLTQEVPRLKPNGQDNSLSTLGWLQVKTYTAVEVLKEYSHFHETPISNTPLLPAPWISTVMTKQKRK